MIKNCLICNKEFKTYPSRIKKNRGVYCSQSCAGKNNKNAVEASMKAKKLIPHKNLRRCKHCKKVYQGRIDRLKIGWGQYCSRKCKSENLTVKRTCIYCTDEFMVYKSALCVRSASYCSLKCLGLDKIGKTFIGKRTIFIDCLFCNKSFRSSIGMKKYKKSFCSRKCKHLYMLGKPNISNTKFLKGHRTWNTGKHFPQVAGENNWHWKGGHRPLYKQIRDCLEYKQWRLAIFMRDKFICQLCFINCERKANADHYPKSFAQVITENNINTFEKALNCKELWNIKNGRTVCVPCHKKTPTFMKPLEAHPILEGEPSQEKIVQNIFPIQEL